MERNKLKTLPKLPGIYIFKDLDNNIIYVGKAKCIHSRVNSYFRKNNSDWKIEQLLNEFDDIEYILTKNEEEALLLEAQLISDKKPKFNVLLKDGQPFLYFLFTNGKIPEIKLVRNKKQKGIYFGPFIKKQQARKVFEFLMRTFQLYHCKQKITTGCLDYHLGLCCGICMDKFDIKDYIFRIELVKNILNGDTNNLSKHVFEKIEEYNKELKFEQAKNLYDFLQKLDYITDTLETHFTENKFAIEIAKTSSTMSKQEVPLSYIGQQLQSFLSLNIEPHVIDCFDISHFQSRSIVGSCIRFTNGIPDKNKFRRFKIRTLETQNDYAALQEIVQRRYKDGQDLPDLIVIDGGKGQLNAVKSLYPNTHFVSIAKREETLFSTNDLIGKHLDIKTEVGKLLIALRDYAHHFAITYHRKKQSLSI